MAADDGYDFLTSLNRTTTISHVYWEHGSTQPPVSLVSPAWDVRDRDNGFLASDSLENLPASLEQDVDGSSSSFHALTDVLLSSTDDWGLASNTSSWMNSTNSSNTTLAPEEGMHSMLQVVVISVLVTILSVVTAGGNLMVMISFKMDKQLQTISNYFLLSLSVADFMIGMVSMPLYTVYLIMGRWPLGPFLCDAWLSLDYTMSNASVANLLIICFDRYYSITRPLTYRAHRTPRRAAIMIGCAWAISLFMWTPWILTWPFIEGKRTVPHNKCYIQFLLTNKYLTIITALAAFYLPVFIMCMLYFKIFMETRKRQKDLQGLQANRKTWVKKKISCSDDEVYVNLNQGRSDSSPDFEDYDMFKDQGRQRPRTAWQKLRRCCRIDRDSDYMEESSSSEPPCSPAYQGTPSSSVMAREHSVSLRRHPHQVNTVQNGKQLQQQQQGQRGSPGNLMIPLITVDSNKKAHSSGTPVSPTGTQITTPSTQVTEPFSSRHSNLSSATGGKEKMCTKEGDTYTILIKLPEEGSEDPNAKPTIRMISESDDTDSTFTERMAGEHIPMKVTRMASNDEVEQCGDSIITDEPSVGRRLTQTTDTLRLAMQARIAARMATKVKNHRARKNNQEKKQDKKAAKTLSAILLAFVVTWTPYNIFTLISPFCDTCIDSTLYEIGKWSSICLS